MRHATLAISTLALVAYAFVGCSSDPSGSGDCDSGEVFDEALDKCVDKAGGTGGDAGGSSGGTTDGSTGTGGGDGSSNNNNNGACAKRTNYVEVYKPNVYFIFDRSESMEGSKMKQAKAGLDQVADKIADKVRIGVSGYPIKSCCCSSRQLLELGEHTPQEIKKSYGSLTAAGGTPTGIALYQVQAGEWLTSKADKHDDKRTKAVIVITDGEPNDGEICRNTVKMAPRQAKKLYNGGTDPSIPVYVVGFQNEGDPAKLDNLAKSGGTDAPGGKNFYQASSSSDLVKALLDITDNSVSCKFKLDPPAPQGSTLNVSLGSETIPSDANNGFQYDKSSATVEVKGSWCRKLQSESKKGTTLEIDVGCPGCALAGEMCSSDSDCCDGMCKGGKCVEACQIQGAKCDSNDDCCSGICGLSGMTGTCVGG